mgnify:CR=1 FL=1
MTDEERQHEQMETNSATGNLIKILLLVTVSILIVTLTVAGVSLTFSIASMKEQSVELLQMQNNTVAESFKGSMDSYKEIVLGTIMDDSVQNYCRQVQKMS